MSSLRQTALEIFRAGLEAADPYRLLRQSSRLEGNKWQWISPSGEEARSWELPSPESQGRILVLGAGKAAASLARALEECLGERIALGRIVVKHGHGLPLARIAVEEAGHPLPDPAGLAATRRLLADIANLQKEDVIFFLLTGGASALLLAPQAGLSLEDKIECTGKLIASGATIREMNTVRKHLSAVKGGRLAERLAPARVLTLIVSDVVGDDLSSIGSGPTAPDPTTYAQSLEILRRYRLQQSIPRVAVEILEKGRAGEIPETPKPGHPVFTRMEHVILASNRLSLEAARRRARELGFRPEVFARDMVGSTHEKARAFAAALLKLAGGGRVALLAGGETTLEVKGKGRGGRNQEFALVAAREIQGRPGVLILAAGTDGTDGPTDAAGAFADGATLSRAVSRGLDPEAILLENDSYRLFDELQDLLRTGPTGTNVMDLVIGLAE